MAQQTIGLGTTADDGTGDTLRAGGGKINDNFTELYTAVNALVKNNYAATVLPTATDDTTTGYAVGSSWLIPGTGEMWRCRSATASAAVWVKVDTADFDGFTVGRYYLPFGTNTPGSGASATANVIRLFYGIIKQRCTIDQLGVRVTTAGTNASIAVYKSNGAGRPTGNPVAKTASFSVGSVAFTTAAPDAGTVTLEPGVYWWATWCDAAYTAIAFAVGPGPSSLVGSASGTDVLGSAPVSGLTVSQTYGTWPDLTAATFGTSTASNGIAAVAFRVASVP